jgi:phosphoribosyl 1,2-cyclic phosphodiesterase
MKHIKTFESTLNWPLPPRKPNYSLFKIDHYHGGEKFIDTFGNENQAKSYLVVEFKDYINKEWDGSAKNYFDEWNPSLNVSSIPSWKEFFDVSHDPEETTFFIRCPDGSLIHEYEVLKEFYERVPTQFENLISW